VPVVDYDDLDDFDGAAGTGLIFSADLANGPLNARREIIPGMSGWAQIVYVRNVDPFDITTVTADAATKMIRMEVEVTYQGPADTEPQVITRVSWLALK